ncbi:MAG: penicillin-binding protein 2 [Patescibacteria group bacterium]
MLNNPFPVQEGKFKNGKLKKFSYYKNWTENFFDPTIQQKETIKTPIKNSVNLKLISHIMVFLMFILIGKTAWLQIVKGEYYYSLAEGNRIRVKRTEPNRGIIYDKNFNSLVQNTANFILYFIPKELPKEENRKNNIIQTLSDILGNKSPDDLRNILLSVKENSLESYQPLLITDNLDYEKAMLFYLNIDQMPGVALSNKSRREYVSCKNTEQQSSNSSAQSCISTESLSHILGYTGKINEQELKKFSSQYFLIDYIGKTGIEYFFENELKGSHGKKQIEIDALGQEKQILSIEKVKDGNNLILSLDINLQNKLEGIMSSHLKKLNLNKACAIIMDPNSGQILALASFPGYDNNIFSKGISESEYSEIINHPDNPLFNRCISGEYPSGSTIKPIMIAAALEEKIIFKNTSFNSVGGIWIKQWFFPDWNPSGHGITNAQKAIAQSVNTFFYYIGGGYQSFQGLGVDRIGKYVKLFGLGSQTGIDLNNEATGLVPTKEWKEKTKNEQWYIGDTYHLAIGQGDLLVTPLQVANFTSAFANNGNLYRPYMVTRILNQNNNPIRNIESQLIRNNFIDINNIKIARQGMREAVTLGSARALQSAPVTSAGKTGTAQWSSKKPPHAWFTGFAPYDNPEIVITILIEQGGEGSSTAVPIAKEVLDWYFKK